MFAAIEEISDRAPVCLPPWLENPYRLVSLWDMLQFNADVFAADSGRLMKFWVGLRRGGVLDDFGSKELGGTLGALERECEKHGLRSSLSQIARIKQYSSIQYFSWAEQAASKQAEEKSARKPGRLRLCRGSDRQRRKHKQNA
jgi:hypothetical protein